MFGEGFNLPPGMEIHRQLSAASLRPPASLFNSGLENHSTVMKRAQSYPTRKPSTPDHPQGNGASKGERQIEEALLSQDKTVARDTGASESELRGSSLTTKPLGFDDTISRVTKWIENDRPGPFLSINCTPEVFTATSKLLNSQDLLPRMAYDYDPDTMTWHLRGRPHILHEVSHSVLQGVKSLIAPRLEGSKFARLADKLVWAHASPTCDLSDHPNEALRGKKEPDTALMMRGRGLPTIVFEVGYSESRAKLRSDARRWLETGKARSGVKRKREDDRLEPVMLAVLISFEGKRPSESDGVNYTEVDFDQPGKPKPLSIFVEMWRLMPVPEQQPATRSNSDTDKALVATMCERKQFFPSIANEDFVTIYITDVLGIDNVSDPRNKVKYRIPLSLFLRAYEERLSMFLGKVNKEEGTAVYEDRIEVSSGDENSDAGGISQSVREIFEDVVQEKMSNDMFGLTEEVKRRKL